MMKFTCKGCGRNVFEPEDPEEHGKDCPYVSRLTELAQELNATAEEAAEMLEVDEESKPN